ncbi:DUF1653 domain-containing protein [uncultured Desulfovibrio sp.]|uniref:DUF1653 domain-containing protein n=1 Tax=Candidatus Desulfovibrio intestinavium TaxID=2838534 RepID=A0A9D2KQC4_9BACT|nr:DUF1653 domain-containing protein [uncultured Desulfovibrio sp.]HJA79632.1 DUF1653 domain-containing protein [Candidatus Desulfovibrio intestinavium]
MAAIYRHFKGNYYQVVGEGLDTRDDSPIIIYRTLYPSDYALFSRPKAEFLGLARLPDWREVRRFTPVHETELPGEARALLRDSLPLPAHHLPPAD